MSNIIRELSDASYFLSKAAELIGEETARITHNIEILMTTDSPINRLIAFKEIKDAVSTIDTLTGWIEDIHFQVERARTSVIETFYP